MKSGIGIQPPKTRGDRTLTIWFYYLLGCLVTIPLLHAVAIAHLPPIHEALGYSLLFVCSMPVISHITREGTGLPVFPIICLVYAGMYAMPVFITPPYVPCMSATFGVVRVSDTRMTQALWLSILGVISMETGFGFFRFSMLNLLVPRMRLELETEKAKRFVLVIGFIGLLVSWSTLTHFFNVPAQFSYIAYLVTTQASLCIAVIALYYRKGDISQKEKAGFFIIVIAMELLGLASGNLRALLDPVIILGAVHWTANRKFPWKYMMIAIAIYVVIQPIKASYRQKVWLHGYGKNSVVDRLDIWRTIAVEAWSHPLLSRKVAGQAVSTNTALSRIDIIHTFARVVELTPRRVPYQWGSTYNYLLYALIPRAIWPGKPSASDANRYFGVAYDFQTEDSVDATSIGLPHLVEAYVNFGSLGVIFVMLIIGMVYAAIDRLLNHPEAGTGGIAIYAVVLGDLWTIETATAPTFGGLIQGIIVYAVILRFVMLKKQWYAAGTAENSWQVRVAANPNTERAA